MAINFPDSSQSPYTDSNGTVWTWQSNKWVATTPTPPTPTPLASNRNLIINGAMQIAQRDDEVTGVNLTGYRTCDRFRNVIGALGTWTIQQSADSPDGFSNSLRMLCTIDDASPASDDSCAIQYSVEGFDCQRLLDTGTTTHPMRLSFWVKAIAAAETFPKTASVELAQPDNSFRQFSTSYTIQASDTWERIVIEIPADTAAVFDNNNGAGLIVQWWLNGGSDFTSGSHSAGWVAADNTARNSTNLGVGGTVNDEFCLTGVQLETGEVATPFEHRPFGSELALCERYYQQYGRIFGWICHNNATTQAFGGTTLRTTMRANPTADYVIPHDDTEVKYYTAGGNAKTLTSLGLNISSTNFIQILIEGSGFVTGNAGHLDINAVDAIKLTAEL